MQLYNNCKLSDAEKAVINCVKIAQKHDSTDLVELILGDPRSEVYWALNTKRFRRLEECEWLKGKPVVLVGDRMGCLLTTLLKVAPNIVMHCQNSAHIELAKARCDEDARVEYFLGDLDDFDESGFAVVVYDEGSLTVNVYDGDKLVFELSYKDQMPYCIDGWTKKHGIHYFGSEIVYQDTELVDKVNAIKLDLLDELFRVCEQYGLKCYLMYGTLLGAVRNGTIIDGDDDIDVALSRADYNELLKHQCDFVGDYFLQTPWNDNAFYGGYLKLRNKNTTEIKPQNWWVKSCEGISIDIFPLDYGFADQSKEDEKRKRIHTLQRMLFAKNYGFWPRFRDMELLEWKFYKYLGIGKTREQLADMLDEAMASTDGKKDSPFGIYSHYNQLSLPRLFPADAFESDGIALFEGKECLVPGDWNSVLSYLYGPQYLVPQLYDVARQRHGFYSADESYLEYEKRFGKAKRLENIKKHILLFGDEDICNSFSKRHSDVLHVDVTVVNKMELVDNQFSEEENQIIIAARNPIEYELVLKDLGYNDYGIYWKNRDWMLWANKFLIK